ncbi:MAG TPA: DUF2975 domain-containing protein [Acidobacteriaceae bacterium]|nr:DUF2975 domain-containing protein [Acidobacteriaceae bacterium]
MSLENEAKLAKIKNLSSVLRVLCGLFMAMCVLVVVKFATGPVFGHNPNWGLGTVWYYYDGIGFKIYSLTIHERVLALLFYTLTSAAAFFCALQLFRLLGFYSRGEIFTSQAVRQIRLWSFACVAWGIVKLAWYFLVPLAIPNASHHLGPDFDTIIDGLIIVAISWFMEMAAEIQEENALTV